MRKYINPINYRVKKTQKENKQNVTKEELNKILAKLKEKEKK
jgi:hypothetical protein